MTRFLRSLAPKVRNPISDLRPPIFARLLLWTLAFSLSTFYPAHAGMWNDERYTFDLASYHSDAFFYSSGPAWLMNAMPLSRISYARAQYSYDRDGDRTDSVYRYASDVGTLANPFNVMLFNNVSIATGGGGISKTSGPITSAPLGGPASWSATPTNGNWVPGGGETNWSTGAGNFPGATSGTTNTDTATFLTSGTTTISINTATLNVKTLTFGSGTVSPSSFTINASAGNSLLLTSGGEIAIVGLPATSNVTETINAPIVLEPATGSTAGTYGFRNSDTAAGSTTVSLVIGGTVTGGTTSSSITLNLNGTNTAANAVSGIISDGGASGGLAITKSNGGTWVLSGNNSYSGGTTVSAGILRMSGSGTLGSTSGLLTVNGGTLDLNGTNQGVGNFTGSGGTILNNATGTSVNFTIGNGNGNGGNYQGVIADHTSGTGTVSVTKTGSGTLTFSGANTYSGGTSVNGGGTLLVINTSGSGTGTTSVTVSDSGTTLAGGTTAGTGGITGAVNINAGANLSPGTSGNGAGTTAILHTGALTLVSGSNFNVDLNSTSAGTGYDQLNVTGTVNLGGVLASNLVVTAGAGLNVGDSFTIINNDGVDPVSGTFAQGAVVMASNNGDVFGINYLGGDGNDVVLTLTAIPEPSTWIGAALALAAIGFTQRRRIRGLIAQRA